MALPKFSDFFTPFLNALSDGEIHTPREVREYIQDEMNISEEDIAEMLPSGQITTFYSRVGWARTCLDKAGLIETPSRAKYRITEDGRKALVSEESIDLKYLDRFDSFKAFHRNDSSDGASSADVMASTDKTPMESLENALEQINDALSDELMSEVNKLTPQQFENLVIKLLLSMGYGNGVDDAGKVTPFTNDGGIDGIIKEDKLGFDNIYIQAKQWSRDNPVGRQEVQKFVGALSGYQAHKGLFITTSKFADTAKKYAENLSGGFKIVLIDGEALMKLMIKYNVGVSTERVLEIKKIDSDFFNDEL